MPLLDRRPDDCPGRLQCVEDQAREHQLPGRSGEPVAGDRERRERPGPVHRGDVSSRLSAASHPDRGADGAETTRREDEPERQRRGAEVVLDDVGEQHLGGAEEDEIRDGGRAERAPEPDALANEAQPLLDRYERRGVRLVTLGHTRPDRGHCHERRSERGRVDGKGEPRTDGDQSAPEERACEAERDRPNELVERVRRGQVLDRQQVRHDGLEGRREERRSDPVERDQGDELPETKCARDHEEGENRNRQGSDAVRPHHHEAAVVPIAHDPAGEQEEHRRDSHPDPDDRQCRGCVPERVALPRDRDQKDAVAEQRDGHSRPEHPEVPVPKR